MIGSSPLWKNKSFVLYLVGQSISALGDGFYLIAFMWLAMEISGGKGLVLGGIFSVYTLNEVIFGFIAGPIADRLDKKRLLIIADIIRGLLVGGIFILVKCEKVTITHLYVITFCFSLVSPFFHRTEFTIIPCILNKEMLLRGNGILAGFRRLMQVVAPAIGGVVIALVGIKSGFFIDSMTFFVSAAFVTWIAVKKIPQNKDIMTLKTLIVNMKEGYAILLSSVFLLTLALYAAFINFLGGPVLPLLPLLAENTNLGSSGYGVMMSVLSVGLIGFLADFIPLNILFLAIGGMLLVGTLIGFILPQLKEDKAELINSRELVE